MTTKLELARRILKELGDLRELRATATSTDLGSFADQLNVWPGQDSLIGSFLLFAGRTPAFANRGHVARVYQNNRGAGEIFYAPNAPAFVNSAEVVYMCNLGGNGWHPFEVESTIADVVNDSYPAARASSALATYTFDSEEAFFEYPALATWDYVERIAWLSPDGTWLEVPPAAYEGGDGWWADPDSETIYFNGDWKYHLDTQTVAITVSGPPTDPSTLTWAGDIELDAEYVVAEAAYRLLGTGIRKDPTRYTLQQALAATRERRGTMIRSRVGASSAAIRLV